MKGWILREKSNDLSGMTHSVIVSFYNGATGKIPGPVFHMEKPLVKSHAVEVGGKGVTDGISKYIEKFLPSRDMKEYLKNAELNIYEVARIIYCSPYAVAEKLCAIEELYENNHASFDDNLARSVKSLVDCMEKALLAKEEDGVYSLETFFYEGKEENPGSIYEFLYSSYDEAVSAIRDFSEFYREAYGEWMWYEITKWGKDKNGKLVQEITYYFVEDELRYINIDHLDLDCVEDMIGGGDLNLPVPFKAGDIVEIDGKPFGPSFRALILDIGDNSDCCCVQGLARNTEGLWNTGAVKHGMIGPQLYPQPSMLYTIERYFGPLDENDRILAEVSYYMKQCADRAYELFEQIAYCGELTDEELRGLINRTD
ncbi:MAG: hypothetical protein K6E75_12555 [Lachnospiraceae bacterium]|nr:hypothetical protein [Lachnospiraceae bacterium]